MHEDLCCEFVNGNGLGGLVDYVTCGGAGPALYLSRYHSYMYTIHTCVHIHDN